ncbi:MAG: magnesium transporter [Myxococcales bacterium]|nr:magnesium transporter [Myxococcales bacterium]
MALGPRLQLLLESLQKLLRRNALNHAGKLLKRSRPADVAVVMRFLNLTQQQQVFDLLPDDAARAETLSELDENVRIPMLATRSHAEILPLVKLMSTDDQADLLANLPDDVRQQLLGALNPSEAEEVEDLLHYGEETAGGIMSPAFFALPEGTTAAEAISALQSGHAELEMAFYIYVVNEPGQLLGVVSLRQLVINPADMPLNEMMTTDVITVDVNADQEEVARMAARYNLLAIPVVDESNRIVGIVTIDDVIDVIREEATEDILKMTGADETAFQDKSVFRNFRTRAPWLFATWLGGLGTSVLIGSFQGTLESEVVLASFMPMILGMGGNVGTQTATIMVRGLATGRVSHGVGLRYLSREIAIGVLLGLFYGVLLAAYAMVRYDPGARSIFALPVTVGMSILTSMSVAAVVGASTPLLFNRLNIDPAVATGPIVTTSVDLLGSLVYFTVATLCLTSL